LGATVVIAALVIIAAVVVLPRPNSILSSETATIPFTSVSLTSNSTAESLTYYTVDGLTCSMPSNTPTWLANLVPILTQSQSFSNVSKGMPFVFGHEENFSNGFISHGGVTTSTLPGTEIVFNNFGPTTICKEPCNTESQLVLFAEVPIENGGFDVANASIHLSTAPESAC
jgi:hypothetical protein